MNNSSRAQGWAICTAVVVLGLWFLLGLLGGSYLALAIPVALVVFFALGLTFWIGYTIATIRVEPTDDLDDEAMPSDDGDASNPESGS